MCIYTVMSKRNRAERGVESLKEKAFSNCFSGRVNIWVFFQSMEEETESVATSMTMTSFIRSVAHIYREREKERNSYYYIHRLFLLLLFWLLLLISLCAPARPPPRFVFVSSSFLIKQQRDSVAYPLRQTESGLFFFSLYSARVLQLILLYHRSSPVNRHTHTQK